MPCKQLGRFSWPHGFSGPAGCKRMRLAEHRLVHLLQKTWTESHGGFTMIHLCPCHWNSRHNRYSSTTLYWLVVWNIFYFPIYWVANHPNWLSYFSEGWPNHQPVYNWINKHQISGCLCVFRRTLLEPWRNRNRSSGRGTDQDVFFRADFSASVKCAKDRRIAASHSSPQLDTTLCF